MARVTSFRNSAESQISELEDQLRQLREAAAARGSSAYDAASEQAQVALKQIRREADQLGRVARDHPAGTAGVLAVVGLTALGLGYLIGRSGSERW